MSAEDVPPADILGWDTAFFGVRIARVRGELLRRERVIELDAWCRQQRVACLYFLSRADDAKTTRVAEDSGFHLMDIRLTFERSLNEGTSGAFQRQAFVTAIVRPVIPEDVPLLRRIARDSFHDTRFYYDRHFPSQKSDALYETWIAKSCEGTAQLVLVAELGGEPVGFITGHREGNAAGGTIGLIGVRAEAQGRGIGQSLVHGALAWFQTQETKVVSVVTQGRNVAAQRLYERSGFLVRGVQLWYHKWYEPAGAPQH